VAAASRDDARVGKTRIRSNVNPASAVGTPDGAAYCLPQGVDALERRGSPPWAPGEREEIADVEQAAGSGDIWCMAEVDIFADLSAQEMETLAAVAPMKIYAAGDLLFTPHQPTETLFILKKGRVRVFRVSADGRALTTALLTPGTIFGEMVLLGQQMHDNFAEAIDEVVGVRDEPGRCAALPPLRCSDRRTDL
jgi:CRP/FNR family transcriptional regulator, cyclic AMP receptor protein